jgi:hypothetical protein
MKKNILIFALSIPALAASIIAFYKSVEAKRAQQLAISQMELSLRNSARCKEASEMARKEAALQRVIANECLQSKK